MSMFGIGNAALANRRKKAVAPVPKPRQTIAPAPTVIKPMLPKRGYKSKRRGFKG